MEFSITDYFEIRNRGTVLMIKEELNLQQGIPHPVEITYKDGYILNTVAYAEWMLRRQEIPPEKQAFIIRDSIKGDFEGCTKIRFINA